MPTIVWIVLVVAAAALGAYIGYLYRRNVAEKKIGRTEEYAKKLLDDATRKAEDNKKEMILAAKEEILHLKSELDKESRALPDRRRSAGRPLGRRTMDQRLVRSGKQCRRHADGEA